MSYDDLAFTQRQQRVNRFCESCNEAYEVEYDENRCQICGDTLRQDHSTNRFVHNMNSNAIDPSGILQRLFGFNPETLLNENVNRPASDKAIQALGWFLADQSCTNEVALSVKGIMGEVIAIPASFGPCYSINETRITISKPITGNPSLQNKECINGCIALMDRGECTFARKAIRAEKAGAVALIIIQGCSTWPYTMNDSMGEAKGLKIPIFMINKSQGEGLKNYISMNRDACVGSIIVRGEEVECVICQVKIESGVKVIRMPCQHLYHMKCLHQWLERRNSCPMCRVEIQSKNSSDTRASSSSNFHWGEWFS